METRANYVAVGAFVLVLLLGIAGVLLWILGGQLAASYAYYEIQFTGSVSGLALDSPVRYNGVPVGRVKEIDIDELHPNQIRVIVELDPVTIIRSNAIATQEMQGITGGTYILISGGTADSPPLPHRNRPPFPLIHSQTSSLQSLFEKAPAVLQGLLDIEQQLKVVLGEQNQRAVAETLDNVRKLSGTLASHSGDIDKIMTNTVAATHDFDDTAKAAGETAHTATDALHRLDGSMGKIDTAFGNANKLVGDVDALVQENRPGLHDFTERGLNGVEQLIANANNLVIKLGRIADELERDPARFLFGDHNKGYQPK